METLRDLRRDQRQLTMLEEHVPENVVRGPSKSLRVILLTQQTCNKVASGERKR